jgi:hypothetical protein
MVFLPLSDEHSKEARWLHRQMKRKDFSFNWLAVLFGLFGNVNQRAAATQLQKLQSLLLCRHDKIVLQKSCCIFVILQYLILNS